MSFSEQLKKARLNVGYTQQQVADFMGITKSTYCGYETGKRQPDVAKIKQLAGILNTSGDVLLETGHDPKQSYNEEPKYKQISKNPNISDVHRQVILQLEEMNDEQIKAVLAFMNTLDELEKTLTNNTESKSTQ